VLKFAADANFNWRILRGIVRRLPGVDLITAQDAALDRAPSVRSKPNRAGAFRRPASRFWTAARSAMPLSNPCVIAEAGDSNDMADRVEVL